MPKEKKIIEGLKLVKKTGVRDLPPVDATEYPFMMEMNCSPPEFMDVTFVLLYGGSEEIFVRADDVQKIYQFITLNNFRNHPRLRYIEITKSKEVIERFEGRMSANPSKIEGRAEGPYR
jgi:hypothetical protein